MNTIDFMVLNKIHLNFQAEKKCEICGNNYDASYFQLLHKKICIFCREIKDDKTYHKQRELLGLPQKKSVQHFKTLKCPKCKSISIRKAKLKKENHSKLFCKMCFNIWENL